MPANREYVIHLGPVTNQRGETRWTAGAFSGDAHVWSSEQALTVRTALRELAEEIQRHHHEARS